MPEQPGNILGLEAKLFISTAGAALTVLAAPANELVIARNVELNLTSSLADVTVRASAWRLQRRALKEASISVELLYSPSDPIFKLLFTAYDSGTPVGLFASDGFGSGLLCDASVTEFSQPQPLEEAVIVKSTLLPTFTTRFPVWIDAAAATPPPP